MKLLIVAVVVIPLLMSIGPLRRRWLGKTVALLLAAVWLLAFVAVVLT